MSVTENSVTYVKDENYEVFNLKYNTISWMYGSTTKPKVEITVNNISKCISINAYLPGTVITNSGN